MPPFEIDASLIYVRDQVLFTDVQLEETKLFPELHAEHQALLERSDAVRDESRAHRDELTRAQAKVSFADDVLDSLVDDVDVDARTKAGLTRTSPGYTMLFGHKRPSDLRRPVLGAQLETLRGWPVMLENADSPELSVHAEPVRKAVEAGDAAKKRLELATTKNREFRLQGNRKKFIDDCNALRSKTYGVIGEYAHKNPKVGPDFVSGFFRSRSRTGKLDVEGIDAEIRSLSEQIAKLQTLRAKLLAEQAAAAQAVEETERRAAQSEFEKAMANLEASKKLVEALRIKMGQPAAE